MYNLNARVLEYDFGSIQSRLELRGKNSQTNLIYFVTTIKVSTWRRVAIFYPNTET